MYRYFIIDVIRFNADVYPYINIGEQEWWKTCSSLEEAKREMEKFASNRYMISAALSEIQTTTPLKHGNYAIRNCAKIQSRVLEYGKRTAFLRGASGFEKSPLDRCISLHDWTISYPNLDTTRSWAKLTYDAPDEQTKERLLKHWDLEEKHTRPYVVNYHALCDTKNGKDVFCHYVDYFENMAAAQQFIADLKEHSTIQGEPEISVQPTDDDLIEQIKIAKCL